MLMMATTKTMTSHSDNVERHPADPLSLPPPTECTAHKHDNKLIHSMQGMRQHATACKDGRAPQDARQHAQPNAGRGQHA